MATMKDIRAYSWDCITYMSEENAKRLCAEQCRNWAMIYHDRDTKEDGTQKQPHRHLVVTFETKKSFASVCRLFAMYAEGQNSLCEPVKDLGACLDYLTHKNDPTKWQYDRKEVIISSTAWFDKYTKTVDEETDNDRFVDDLLAPSTTFSVVSMARKYGRDFMRNMRSYMEFRKVALFEEMGGNAIDYFAHDSQAEQFNDIVKE